MKNVIEYFQSKGFLEDDPTRGIRFKAANDEYSFRAEPAELTIQEARQLLGETFDEASEVRVWLNDSYAYMDEDIESRLDNMLGEAVATKFGLETEGEDKAQFLYAKVASPKQADNFVNAVVLYDKIAHSDGYKALQGRVKKQQQALHGAMKTGLAKIVV